MKHIVIIGGGVSGKASALLADKLRCSGEIVTDDSTGVLPDGGLYVVSPGVFPLKSALYRQAQQSGIPMISELEFGFRALEGIPVLAVTGTNGKTTTTELTTHLLKCGGLRAAFAGNIGVPLAEVAAGQMTLPPSERLECIVAEVSNFQLELVDTFAPRASLLLNLASDHVDRYRSGFEEYCRIKHRIFDRVAPENRIFGLSFADASRRVTYAGNDLLIDGQKVLYVADSRLNSPHNRENLAGAVELALRVLDRQWFFSEQFRLAVISFAPGEHRCEKVTEIDGVCFVNDSKGTNPAAVAAAVNSISGKVVLMLGGLNKGMDFSPLAELAPRLRAAVFFGECRRRIAAVFAGSGVVLHDCGMDFELAVTTAYRAAMPGDTVLLSPACASFDMFKSYSDRGEKFKILVNALKK